MCGIVGLTWNDMPLVKRMASLIKYRGPDQEGYYSDGSVSIGNKRLKIVDLTEKGRQPITNEKGDMFIVFNGEIFNHEEVRKILIKQGHRFSSMTDTETILHAFEEYGYSCLDLLNGFFAFAIYDSTKKTLFLARDRLGIKPLYYLESGNGLVFASEIKSILESGIKRELNRNSMERFIAFGYNFGEDTMFLGIKKLMPGHFMKYDLKKKSLTIEKYWELRPRIDNKPESFFIGKLEALLLDSVQRRMLAEVPVGAYLSGGIDSSLVVGAMSTVGESTGTPIKTYCVGFGRDDDEFLQARLVSEHLGTEHTEFTIEPDMSKVLPKIIWHSDDPIGDPAFVPIYLLTQKVRPQATVVLTGDGGDEFFAGYEQVKFLTKLHKTRFIPKYIRACGAKASLSLVPNKALDALFKHASSIGEEGKKRAFSIIANSHDRAQAFVDFTSMFNENESDRLLLRKSHSIVDELRPNFSSGNYFDQIMLTDIKNQLPEAFCMKNDKMTMAHSVEMRTPLLDYRIAEFSFTMPHNLKLSGMREKYALRRILMHYVPKEIYSRKKQRFYVPIDAWLLNELKPMAQDLLSERKLKRQGLFDYRYVERIERGYKKSPLFYARQMWNLITFQLWFEMFIEGRKHG